MDIIGIGIGILGIVIAIYQGFERKKLENYVRSQSWYLYSKTNNAIGILQEAIDKYKNAHKDNINNDVIEGLAHSNALGQELYKETIRYIQLSEPKFDHKTIDRWVKNGKIDKDHSVHFIRIANDR